MDHGTGVVARMRREIGHQGRTKSPCQGCSDRSSECHAKCEKYAEYSKTHMKEVRDIHKKKREYNLGFGAPFKTDRKFKQQQIGATAQVKFQRQEQRLKERMNNNGNDF